MTKTQIAEILAGHGKRELMREDTTPDLLHHHHRCTIHDISSNCTCERERLWDLRQEQISERQASRGDVCDYVAH